MNYIPVTAGTKEAEEVRQLYQLSFPVEDQISFDKLLEHSKDEKVTFLGAYENNSLIAFGFYVEESDAIFGLYFAINPAFRSNGYGTNIIREILGDKLLKKPLIMDAEEPEKGADETNNKVRRIKFYEKLGLKLTNYCISNGEVMFRILSTTGKADVWRYIEFLDKFCNFDAYGNPLTYTAYQDNTPEPLKKP